LTLRDFGNNDCSEAAFSFNAFTCCLAISNLFNVRGVDALEVVVGGDVRIVVVGEEIVDLGVPTIGLDGNVGFEL